MGNVSEKTTTPDVPGRDLFNEALSPGANACPLCASFPAEAVFFESNSLSIDSNSFNAFKDRPETRPQEQNGGARFATPYPFFASRYSGRVLRPLKMLFSVGDFSFVWVVVALDEPSRWVQASNSRPPGVFRST